MPGLIKRTDQVFSTGVIDPGFTSHGTVNLGEKSRRNLHKRNPAQISGGRKTSNIADYSAAKCQQAAIPVEVPVDQNIENLFESGDRFLLFAIWEADDLLLAP